MTTQGVKKWMAQVAAEWLAFAMIIIGAILRLRQYFHCRSLWVDEADLALDIIKYPMQAMTGPFANNQAAPPAFMAATKIVTSIFGTSEYAFRLLPMLASIGALFLIRSLARRFLSPWAVAAAVGLFALNPQAIRYANEFKQYSGDIFSCIAILLTADLYAAGRIKPLFFAMLGAVIVWFSHPSVFVLAAAGSCVMLQSLLQKNWRAARITAVCIAAWLASFAVLYEIALTRIRHDSYFSTSSLWSAGYLPWPWNSGRAFKWLKNTFIEFTGLGLAPPEHSFTGSRIVMSIAAILILISVACRLRTNRHSLYLLAMPAVIAFAAAVMHSYPFMNRLIVFLIPVVVLLIADGLDVLFLHRERIPMLAKLIGVAAMLIHPAAMRCMEFKEPLECEEIRPLMRIMARQRQPGDAIYVYYAAKEAFEFYSPRFGFTSSDVVQGLRWRKEPKHYLEDLLQFRGRPRRWVIFSHPVLHEDRFILHTLDQWGRQISQRQTTGASLHLYDLTAKP